jgi:hypothetical protein
MDAFPPISIRPPTTETLDPHLVKDLNDIDDPRCNLFRIEHLSPIRLGPLTDTEELTQSCPKTDIAEQAVTFPEIDTDEPHLAYDLNDILLPRAKKLNTETLDPVSTLHRTDKELPRFTKLMIDPRPP